MKKIIVVAAVLIMLMGGGISVMKSLEIGPFAPVGDGSVDVVDESHQEDMEPIITKLDPLTIPVFRGDSIAATVQLEIHLEALGKDNSAEVKRYAPKISDIFLRDLHSYLPRLIETQGEMDVEMILARLNNISKKSKTTKDIVNRVLIQAISDTPGMAQ